MAYFRTTDEDAGMGARSEGVTLFGSTMALVAATMGCFCLGAFVGHNLSYGWAWAFYIVSFALLIGMRFTVRASRSASVGLLFAFGLTMGLATGPTVVYYANSDPATVWQAAGATALFMAGLGSAGYAVRRDLSTLGRLAMWALLALIVFGIVTIFVQISGASLAYSIIGLAIFAVFVLVDFQRLRTVGTVDSAPLLATSIFLDILNVFLFFLNLFRRRD